MLAELVGGARSEGVELVHAIEGFRKGWRSSTCAFALSFKKAELGAEDGEIIQRELEQILHQLPRAAPWLSARLTVEDDEGLASRVLEYVYGPEKVGGEPRWTRTSLKVTRGETSHF